MAVTMADTMTEAHSTASHEFTPKNKKVFRVLALNLGLGAILVGLLLLFIMPSLKSGPHELPVGVVGDQAVAQQTEAALNANDPEAFVVTSYGSADELNEAIRTRQVMGGFDYSQVGEMRVAVASAGSTAVSGTLTQMGQAIAKQANLEPRVDDIVALPAADKTGTGIGGRAFPLVFGGIVPVVAFRALLAGHRNWIMGGIIVFSLVGGFIVSLVLQEMFSSTEGVLWPGAIAAVGQLLPPGATGSLVRAVAYFDGHGGAHGFWTLTAWVILGIVLWGLAPLVQSRSEKRAAAKESLQN